MVIALWDSTCMWLLGFVLCVWPLLKGDAVGLSCVSGLFVSCRILSGLLKVITVADLCLC